MKKIDWKYVESGKQYNSKKAVIKCLFCFKPLTKCKCEK